MYAYTAELDAWRESRAELIDKTPPAPPAGGSDRARYPRPWIAAALVVVLAAAAGAFWLIPRPVATTHTPNPEAIRLLRQANFSGNAGAIQIQTAIRDIQEAIRIDPAYPPGWAALATGHVAQTWFGELPATQTMSAAKRAAGQALRLDPSNSAAHRVLGWVAHYQDWDHMTAERHFREAIDLDASSAVAHSWFGDFLVDLRRFDEARVHYRKANDLNPRWLEPMTFAANTFTFTGSPDLAVGEQRRVLELEPNFGLGIHFLGRSYLAQGDYPRAIEQLQKSNEVLGRVPFSVGDLGYALALGGRRDEAEQLLTDLAAKRGTGYYPAFPIAQIHLGLGATELALDWLDRAADERHLGFFLPSADPVYDSIRSHPRFEALIRRINLAGSAPARPGAHPDRSSSQTEKTGPARR